jgi:two-component system, cell cycle sensor histidine kinase and response regulator CckA
MELRLTSKGLRIRADRGQLEQALLNLTLNARDAMPTGGRVTLATRPVELEPEVAGAPPGFAIRPGPYLRLTFADTGHGMEPDTLSHLFEPFFTTKPVGKGTGLGLATVYGIVKQSDGYVWVSSEPGHGTTFTVHVPVLEEAESLPDVGPPPARAVPGEVILIVEDEPDVLTMTARVLREEGYGVLEAASGQLALELLSHHRGRLDLVLADVVMPEVNGPDLVLRLRSQFPRLPVVFMSGYLGDEAVHQDLLVPDSAFLLKPFAPETLAASVRSLLDK